ncbi:MAG: hypothetical protein ACODAJ_10850 [Planctomycetota bacterium]
MPDYTPHQRRIIRNYYDRKPEIMLQKLGELVSEIAVEEDEGKRKRLWSRAEKALRNLEVPAWRIEKIMASRDVNQLAEVVEDFF